MSETISKIKTVMLQTISGNCFLVVIGHNGEKLGFEVTKEGGEDIIKAFEKAIPGGETIKPLYN